MCLMCLMCLKEEKPLLLMAKSEDRTRIMVSYRVQPFFDTP